MAKMYFHVLSFFCPPPLNVKGSHCRGAGCRPLVYVNGCASSKAQLTNGVPQGLILSPLLFLVFINDLATVSSTVLLILFADDTNLILTNQSFAALMAEANSGIMKFSIWFQLNKLPLNKKKKNQIVLFS